MIDPKLLRTDRPAVARNLARRGFVLDVAGCAALEERRHDCADRGGPAARRAQRQRQGGRQAKGQGRGHRAAAGARRGAGRASSPRPTASSRRVQAELDALAARAAEPAARHRVPDGRDESANVEVRRWGEPRAFSFKPQDHVAVGERLGGMDFEAAGRISGARFVVMRGALARLQRALAQFMLDLHTGEHGYTEIYVPYLVARRSAAWAPASCRSSSRICSRCAASPGFYLIPTAEVPLTNLVREQILAAESLPLKFVAHTPCFRSEAGAAGKDTRGMIRQHQFDKVELVQIVRPEDSYAALEAADRPRRRQCCRRLELPYRVMALCAGDVGFASAKTYDLEVWLPVAAQYREISSCSNCEAFQARRMQARWRNPATGKPEPLHTLNGSGVAVGRALVAVLENYQNEDGSVTVPQVLRPYMGDLDGPLHWLRVRHSVRCGAANLRQNGRASA